MNVNKALGKFFFSNLFSHKNADAMREKQQKFFTENLFSRAQKRRLFDIPRVLCSIHQINWFRVYVFFVRKLLRNLLIFTFQLVSILFTSQTTHSEYFMQTETYLPQIFIEWSVWLCVRVNVCALALTRCVRVDLKCVTICHWCHIVYRVDRQMINPSKINTDIFNSRFLFGFALA